MSDQQKVVDALCETARNAKVTIKELTSALAYVARNEEGDLRMVEEFMKLTEGTALRYLDSIFSG